MNGKLTCRNGKYNCQNFQYVGGFKENEFHGKGCLQKNGYKL
jgi:hypothetical protein